MRVAFNLAVAAIAVAGTGLGLMIGYNGNQSCADTDRHYNLQEIERLQNQKPPLITTEQRLRSQLAYENKWLEWNSRGFLHKAFVSCESWADWD